MNHTKIGILAAVAIMLIAATSLATIIEQQQAYASSSRHSATKVGEKEIKSQHSNQLTLCYRSLCKDSILAQQNQGNDDQLTGFSDESFNVDGN
jgi:hypothetical protein